MSSFLTFYQQFKNKIFTYFLYRVGFEREIAEDLTSEVFIKAYENFDGFDLTKPFQPWIYRIAHNRLVNHYRDSKPEASVEEMAEDNFLIADKKYANGLFNHLDHQFLLKHLEQLPRNQAELLIYRYVDQLEYSEIAQITGQEEGTIRVSHHRALENLRNKIEQL